MATTKARVSDEVARKRQDKKHEQILKGLMEQFEPVFEHSPDGVYLYLDDKHKICNKRMAEMFGLTVEEWQGAPNFLADFVAPGDQEQVAAYYWNHIPALSHPVTFRFHGVRKNGQTFLAETDMIPISWNGQAVAYHFVREIG